MLSKFISHISTNFSFLKDTNFIIACSGGVDSIVLAVLLQKLKYNFALAHCNFNLRGKESDADQKFVAEFSNTIEKKLFLKHFDTIKEQESRGGSIQMVARDLRYTWFNELLVTEKYEFVLTAHHADDCLETFIINLSRGTGANGLHGIPAKKGTIIRPLLPFSRNQIKAYASANHVSWREDSSNAEEKYLRNQIRHSIVPRLKELNPNFLANFLNTQALLQESSAILKNTKEELQYKLFVEEDGVTKILINQLKQLKPLKSYLYLLFNEFGFTAWDDILNLLDTISGKEICSATHRLIKDRDYLLLAPLAKKKQLFFLITKDIKIIVKPINLELEKVNAITDLANNILYVDMEKLNFPLVLRKSNTGDYFYPIGMKGKKKLSKFLKDEKVNLIEKEKQWVLCSNKDVVWVLGRRPDERFKVRPTTKQIVKITWRK